MPPFDPKFGFKNPNPNQPTKEYLDELQEFVRLHNFIEKVIGPWATQARISQIIAEDYDEYDRMESTLRNNLRTATAKTFTPRSPGQSQIGGTAYSYLGPAFKPLANPKDGYVEKYINRNITEQELVNGEAVVRMYTAVFMEAIGSNQFKDVYQEPATKKIIIQDSGGVLWVGGGQPLRALKWMEKYKYSVDPNTKKAARPIIRSFQLPANIYQQISAAAEPEDNGPANKDSSINVDVHAASDQWGVRGPSLAMMKEKAIPGSLISYADDLSFISPAYGGQVTYADVLRNRLGVPVDMTRDVEVFLTRPRDGVNAEFQDRHSFEGIADKLMCIYGVWTGNEQFLSESWRKTPGPARLDRMRRVLKDHGVIVDEGVWKKVTSAGNPSRLAQSGMEMLRRYNRPIT
ncbi:hypothetical protein AciX8_4245 [Granulicella mallensis MP5ACTX8]|uniref:Uncharacterized protein n=2 Tax=Granulicella mallensis TaxID=940614 RepID=G8NSE6_GRAMM|nr:hypothetical protein AciX8_4245 [Granulicella mallensis MP5ACTX8]